MNFNDLYKMPIEELSQQNNNTLVNHIKELKIKLARFNNDGIECECGEIHHKLSNLDGCNCIICYRPICGEKHIFKCEICFNEICKDCRISCERCMDIFCKNCIKNYIQIGI